MSYLEKRSWKMEKKGQVTIFIILGILIIIIAGVLLFINRDTVSGGRITSGQVEPIREYLRECVEEILREDLTAMRKNSGYLDSSSLDKINSCDGGETAVVGDGSSNRLKLDLSIDLLNSLNEKFLIKCGLNEFTDDFVIQQGDFDFDILLSNEAVDVKMNTNTIVGRGDGRVDLGEISIILEDDIYSLNELARKMTTMYSGSNLIDVTRDVNQGDLFLINADTYSNKILGNNCDLISGSNYARPSCNVDCPNGCCLLLNKFQEENNLEPFRFGLR
jgi:hypothetical protein